MNSAVLLLIGAIILSVVGTVALYGKLLLGWAAAYFSCGLFIWRYQLLHEVKNFAVL